ncbi:hypothetical protein [Pedobacter sp.]|uniref:hypothetical protein n=1 Tax=Pedobacter sp. TaxID=1411316 RepID=UPI003C3539AA
MKNKYRIVTDTFAGYEAQVKYWWWPITWFQIGGINTNISIEQAKRHINFHKGKVVYEE